MKEQCLLVLETVVGIVIVAAAASTPPANVLWPCSSSHRLPEAGAPVYFQLQAAAGCECVFTLEGPPGTTLRVSLGERSSRGYYGVAAPVRAPFRPPPKHPVPDCALGAVRAFALEATGELALRATLCGPRERVQPFETDTPVAVLTTTAPWGHMVLRVDVMRPSTVNGSSNTTSTNDTSSIVPQPDSGPLQEVTIPSTSGSPASSTSGTPVIEAVEAEMDATLASLPTVATTPRTPSVTNNPSIAFSTISANSNIDSEDQNTDESINVV